MDEGKPLDSTLPVRAGCLKVAVRNFFAPMMKKAKIEAKSRKDRSDSETFFDAKSQKVMQKAEGTARRSEFFFAPLASPR